MKPTHDEWRFDARHVGRRVLVFDELPSTNDAAAALADDTANAGTVFVAASQSAGRGTHGRTWTDGRGCSLLMSVLLFPPRAIDRPVILTAWATVAVADAIRALTGADAVIKWPNDLLLGGKKCCGILIERSRGTVVGIGLNLTQSAAEFAAAGLPDATSLGFHSGTMIDPTAALGAVVRSLDEWYDRLVSTGSAALETAWKQRSHLVGRHVVAETTDAGTVSGRLCEMGFDGLEFAFGDGAFRVLTPEAVRHMKAS